MTTFECSGGFISDLLVLFGTWTDMEKDKQSIQPGIIQTGNNSLAVELTDEYRAEGKQIRIQKN